MVDETRGQSQPPNTWEPETGRSGPVSWPPSLSQGPLLREWRLGPQQVRGYWLLASIWASPPPRGDAFTNSVGGAP